MVIKIKKLFVNLLLTAVIGSSITPMLTANGQAPVAGKEVSLSDDKKSWFSRGASSSAESSSGSWFSWGGLFGVSLAVTACTTLYFKLYQRRKYKGIIEDIKNKYIYARNQRQHGLLETFTHWRMHPAAAGEADFWTSAAQIKRDCANVKGLLLTELHDRRIIDRATGRPFFRKDKDDKEVPVRNTLDSTAMDLARKNLLPSVKATIEKELDDLITAMKTLSKIDSTMPDAIFNEWDRLQDANKPKDSSNYPASSNFDAPAGWTPVQETALEDAMIEKCKESKANKDGYSWYEWLWYGDPYYEARYCYWQLFKYKSRLDELLKVVKEIMIAEKVQSDGGKNAASAPSVVQLPAASGAVGNNVTVNVNTLPASTTAPNTTASAGAGTPSSSAPVAATGSLDGKHTNNARPPERQGQKPSGPKLDNDGNAGALPNS